MTRRSWSMPRPMSSRRFENGSLRNCIGRCSDTRSRLRCSRDCNGKHHSRRNHPRTKRSPPRAEYVQARPLDRRVAVAGEWTTSTARLARRHPDVALAAVPSRLAHCAQRGDDAPWPCADHRLQALRDHLLFRRRGVTLWQVVGLEGKWREKQWEKRSEEHTSELQSPYDLVCRL